MNNVTNLPIHQLLASHDWYFEMSDDIRAWRKGAMEQTLIKTKLHNLEKTQALQLLAKYAKPECILENYLAKE